MNEPAKFSKGTQKSFLDDAYQKVINQEMAPLSQVPVSEPDFQDWYAGISRDHHLAPNPDDPLHFYNYRDAYKYGAEPNAKGHWPSKYKAKGHPNRFVDGIDTITGKPMTDKDYIENINGQLEVYKSLVDQILKGRR